MIFRPGAGHEAASRARCRRRPARCAAIVRAMYDDDYVSSVPYRLMSPRKRTGSDIGRALDAVKASGSAREALDAASGTALEPAGPAADLSWTPPEPSPLRRCSRSLGRVDVWILIVGLVGLVIAYLAWMKPH